MQIMETGNTAWVIMGTRLDIGLAEGSRQMPSRRAAPVFQRQAGPTWQCVIDHSQSAALLDETPATQPAAL